MTYKLFFKDEFFGKDEFYMVRVTKQEFFSRVDFISEYFVIVKKDIGLGKIGYYANNIIFGIATEKG